MHINSNLSTDELERIAYLSGNLSMSHALRRTWDLEVIEEALYDAGLDHKEIAPLVEERDDLSESLEGVTGLMEELIGDLEGWEGHFTAKNRRALIELLRKCVDDPSKADRLVVNLGA